MNIKITGNINECFAGVENFKKDYKNKILANTKKKKIKILLCISIVFVILTLIISKVVSSPVLDIVFSCLSLIFALLSLYFVKSSKLETKMARWFFIDIDEIVKMKTNEEYGSSLDIWDAVNSNTLLSVKTKSISDNERTQNLEFSIKNISSNYVSRINEQYTIMLTADKSYSGLIAINVQNKTVTQYYMDKIPQGVCYILSEQERELSE